MTKWIFIVGCMLVTPLGFAQADLDDRIEDRLGQIVERIQAREQAEVRRTPVSQIQLSAQGKALLLRVMQRVQAAKQAIAQIPCPAQEPQPGTDPDERLENIGEILDNFTDLMDEYNALRTRDVKAARVAGARMAEEVFECKGGDKFTIPAFLDTHKKDLPQVIVFDELLEELTQFSRHLAQDKQPVHP